MEFQLNELVVSQTKEVLSMMEEFYGEESYPFDREKTERNLRHFIREDRLGRIWIIQSNDRLIGYIILTFGFSFEYEGRDAFIDEFYIRESYRGQGLGGKVLDRILTEAKHAGVKALHLEVEKRNEHALLLYERRGFTGNKRRLMSRML